MQHVSSPSLSSPPCLPFPSLHVYSFYVSPSFTSLPSPPCLFFLIDTKLLFVTAHYSVLLYLILLCYITLDHVESSLTYPCIQVIIPLRIVLLPLSAFSHSYIYSLLSIHSLPLLCSPLLCCSVVMAEWDVMYA